MSFSKSKEGQVLSKPLIGANPIMVQTLGVCSALAVTVQLKPAIVMSLCLTVVLTMSNVIMACIRNFIPGKIRIITYMLVISTLVALADQILKAYVYDISKTLSVFVGLIITNCIVMGRAEAFAMTNTPKMALLDGLGNGAGYSIVLLAVAFFRELFGSGKLLGTKVVPQALYDMGYVDNGLLMLAPGAFFIIGILIWVSNSLYKGER
ncbi:MAG: NADH:ubiquinone reductase (Na(+)-transporting) subunit D [Planctomycetes bacterium]|nr:NADH:ubiquinone reductase (Na(+)-transporting) subunit D [Planctomycetota bacterium]